MKTLKKTLSLTLVFALVFSLMSMAFAAETTTTSTTTTGYKDAADITYKEAVDVTSAIGVFQGNDLGAFAPKDNLTREQAAKIICYLSMGQAAADKLSTSSAPFADVAADRWSAGSIAYCVQQGIVAGYGNGNFGPNDSVTGYQFEKMLLVALSYDPSIEGFTGNDWQINVAKRAFQNKLSEGNDAFVGTAAATREEAALYTKNTLLAGVVSYDNKGTEIKLPDGTTVRQGASAPTQGATFMASYYSSLKVNAGDTRAALGTGSDAFGRNANVWTLKGVKIGEYAADATLTYTAKMQSTASVAELTKALKGCTLATGAAITINGNTGAGATIPLTSSFVSQISNVTGNGKLVQIYTDANNAKIITGVTVVTTDLVKVTAIGTKSVTLETKSANAVQGTYTVKDGDTCYDAVKGLKVGDYVLVTPAWVSGTTYTVAKVAIPEQVAGYITTKSVNPNDGILNVTVNNSKSYAESAAKTASVAFGSIDTSATLTATLWLDSYGYVANVKAAAVSGKDFLYVTKAYSTITNGEIVHMAKGYLTDGTAVDVVANVGGAQAENNTLYAATVANDEYTLTTVTPVGAAGSTAPAAAKSAIALTAGGKILASDKTLTAWTQSNNGLAAHFYNNYYATDVKFIYTDATNKSATIKTGVQAVNSITANSVAIVEDDGDGNMVVTAVILANDVSTTVASDSLIFFPSDTAVASQILKDSTGKTVSYPVYVGYKNGEQVMVPTKSTVDNDNNASTPYVPSYFAYAMNDSVAGAYVLATAPFTASSTTSTFTGMVTKTFSDTLISAANAAHATITDIDISGAKFADVRTDADKDNYPVVLTAAGICSAAKNNLTVSVVYNAETGKASLVYVCARATGFKIAAQTSGVTFWLDQACTASPITLAGGTTPTLVPAGTTVYVKTSATGKILTGTPTLKPVVAAGPSATATYSFTMPMGSVANDAFTETAGIALAAPTITSGKGVTATATLDKTFVKAGDTVTVTVTLGGTASDTAAVTASGETTNASITLGATHTNFVKTSETVVTVSSAGAVSGTFTYSYTVSAAAPTFTIA